AGAQRKLPAAPPRPPRAPRTGSLEDAEPFSEGGAVATAEANPLSVDGPGSEAAEWRAVFEQFVQLKRECGESLDGFTYEKFENTLRKNRDALIARHGASKVKFSVYVKDGKAALKASPVRD
ncbi:MAG: MXAN_5187 C-terminal domain-containing protein, partial [Pseudomonadota bacterium]